MPTSYNTIIIIIAVGRMRKRLPSFPVLLYCVSPYLSTLVKRQLPPKCHKLGTSTEPALMVMSVNIEGLSSAKQQIIAELCANPKCDVLCMQETHRCPGVVRHRVHGMNIVAEIAHE